MPKLNIIFDLDETLIQTVTKNNGMVHNFNSNPEIIEFPPFSNIGCIQYQSMTNEPSPVYIVSIRGGTRELLDYCYAYFDVSFWTAGSYKYAREVLKLLISEEQYDKTKMILAHYKEFGNYIDLKQTINIDYIEIEYKINNKNLSPIMDDLFEKNIDISSEKKYFVAEKDLFTFPYITENNMIMERGDTLSNNIIYNTKKIKKNMNQYNIKKYIQELKKTSNAKKSNWNTDGLLKPLNMLWENPNFNKIFTPKNTIMVDDHKHVKHFFPKNTIYITQWCRMEKPGPNLKYYNDKKKREWMVKNNKDSTYDKRENTILLYKLKKWLETHIINKKVINIQKTKLINLGQTFKVFDLIEGDECRALTPYENGGSYEKYLNVTCSANRDCVVDIMNDIEKFRFKMKKTLDDKYSSLIDNDIDKLLSIISTDHINNEINYDQMMENPLISPKQNNNNNQLLEEKFEPNLFNWWKTQKKTKQVNMKTRKKKSGTTKKSRKKKV